MSKFSWSLPVVLVVFVSLSLLYSVSFVRYSESSSHVCISLPRSIQEPLGILTAPPELQPKCAHLFQYGIFQLDDPEGLLWRPMTCRPILFSNKSSLPSCLKKLLIGKNRNLTVIELYGDSRMRQLQSEIGKIISGRAVDQIEYDENCKCNRSIYCDPVDTGTQKLPWIHEHCLFKEHRILLRRWQRTVSGSGQPEAPLELVLTQARIDPPDIILVNSGAHLLHRCQSQSLTLSQCSDQYRSYLMEIKPILAELSNLTNVIWMPQNMVNRTSSMKHFPKLYDVILPHWNVMAYRMFSGIAVHYWWSLLQFFDFFGDIGDGLHLGPLALNYAAQVIFNVLCKRVTEISSGICCYDPDYMDGNNDVVEAV